MKIETPAYMRISPIQREPGAGLTVTITLELKTPRQVLGFAWDMARDVSVSRWWHRPAVFFGLLAYGFGEITSRPA